jgi:hypothetical protein
MEFIKELDSLRADAYNKGQVYYNNDHYVGHEEEVYEWEEFYEKSYQEDYQKFIDKYTGGEYTLVKTEKLEILHRLNVEGIDCSSIIADLES